LSILESLTPNYSKDAFEDMLKGYGLKIILSISPYSSEWQSSIAEYQITQVEEIGTPKRGWNDSYYLIKAEKITAVIITIFYICLR